MAHDFALKRLEATDRAGESLGHDDAFNYWCSVSGSVLKKGGRQYLIGNGASAAFANHMALDWTKNGGIPTHSFASSPLITALGNDLGFEESFSAPLSWYGRGGDMLVTISSSGNSENIVRAIAVARQAGMHVVTLSGLKVDNRSRQLGDLNLYVPAKTYGIVECAHQVLLHIWLDQYMGVMEWARDDCQNMRKSEFNI